MASGRDGSCVNASAPSSVAKSLAITIVFGSATAQLIEWPVAPCCRRTVSCSVKTGSHPDGFASMPEGAG